jgi:hypothetical protein
MCKFLCWLFGHKWDCRKDAAVRDRDSGEVVARNVYDAIIYGGYK